MVFTECPAATGNCAFELMLRGRVIIATISASRRKVGAKTCRYSSLYLLVLFLFSYRLCHFLLLAFRGRGLSRLGRLLRLSPNKDDLL